MSEPNAHSSPPHDSSVPSNEGGESDLSPPESSPSGSSPSEQLAELLGLHIPIPTYTPPEGDEALDMGTGSPVETEPWRGQGRDGMDADESSLADLFQERLEQRSPQAPPKQSFSPPPSPLPPPDVIRPTVVSSPRESSSPPAEGDMDLLQDILVRPELQEFRRRLEKLEGQTAELGTAQRIAGADVEALRDRVRALRENMDETIVQLIHGMVDDRFARLEQDWQRQIDRYLGQYLEQYFEQYFEQSFQRYLDDYFGDYFDKYFGQSMDREWSRIRERVAQQIDEQLKGQVGQWVRQMGDRVTHLENQMAEVTVTLATALRSLQDVSPDFAMGVRLAEVERQLKGLTQNLATFAGGLGVGAEAGIGADADSAGAADVDPTDADTADADTGTRADVRVGAGADTEAISTLAELKILMVEDGTIAADSPIPAPAQDPLSEVEVSLQLGQLEAELRSLNQTIGELGEELGDRQDPVVEDMALGDRLERAELRLTRLTQVLTVLVQGLRRRSAVWDQGGELGDRLERVELELGQLTVRVVELSENLPLEIAPPKEPEVSMLSSSLSIRVKGVDPRWTVSEPWSEPWSEQESDGAEEEPEEPEEAADQDLWGEEGEEP